MIREIYKLLLVGVISFLIIVTVISRLYIVLVPIVLFSIYLINESRIPEIKDLKSFHKYVEKVYGRDFAAIIKKRYNIIQGDLTLAYFPSSIEDNTVVIANTHLILKINSRVFVLSKYEGVDYLVDIIKGNVAS
ncbi:hypothetical protein SULI_00655 [Saccharolobus solfataricus]|uniref:Uncharacterized protein n=3 Tax=Saccharolobus solfataricus TaxID=2287 RepID=Q97WA9_SACS2|nr:hypothetical protein [Saccharolobus solfataricus]AAK42479.1 Hypothetical protein SSO2326 [Saccharolobus solfataricus P2]AKA72579.1 hypothetical protein SULB_0131 [Saccharolobus solfataricus]AKA75278.1 hypothetical protein SULC_0130 [Saccharolobus solfataricus]AKA77971.1 hypothetical protein SULA_0130 [Saccharolobus solfataricus]AZF67089.1 hypothetical protein SULG_00655 [Saccharolobus solfataricus]